MDSEKMQKRFPAIIKESVVFGEREFYFSLFVFAYLFFSFSVISFNLAALTLFLMQTVLMLFENYMTAAVYYGIKQHVFRAKFEMPGIFVKAGRFFFRVLAYKVFAAFFVLLLAGFSLSMIEVVKDAAPVIAGLITGFTILWISFPAYLLLLTFYSPLIIVGEDSRFLPSLRKSVAFTRANLKEIAFAALLAAPFWGFALFLIKLYNESGLVFMSGVLYFVAVLEVITVKLLFVLYRERQKR